MKQNDQKQHDEYVLIHRTQHGDTEAFTPVVQKYYHRLYAYISSRVKDPETAKDLTQETWMKAFRAINAFRGDSAFYSWIYRIAENVCTDYHRKQQAKDDILPLHTVAECQFRDTYPDPADAVQELERLQILTDAIQHLPPTRKRVFLLYYVEELPIKVIATRINRSEGTIKTHLRNARLQLRESLTSYLKDEDIPWLAS